MCEFEDGVYPTTRLLLSFIVAYCLFTSLLTYRLAITLPAFPSSQVQRCIWRETPLLYGNAVFHYALQMTNS